MGGLIARYSVAPDNPFVRKLCKIKPQEVFELVQYYQATYLDSSSLNYEQFDDLFAPYLNETVGFFDQLRATAAEADWYEALAITILSCNATGKWKVLMLFSLFDFDESGQIEMCELRNTIGVCLRALSRLADAQPPLAAEVATAARAMFEQIDSDQSHCLDQEEVIQWAASNKEVQELMCSLAHKQGIELALLRYEEKLQEYLTDPLQEGPEQLLARLRKMPELCLMDEEEWTLFTRLFIRKDGSIHKTDYTETMKNWVAFVVADYSNNQLLSRNELKVLLSFKKGQEVAEYVVDEQMRLLDLGGDGSVSRKEWLRYLYVEDGFSVKSSFDLIDADLSGRLSVSEIGSLLKSALPEGDADFIKGLAADILVLNDRKEVNWLDFKAIWPEIQHKIEVAKGLLSD